MNTRSILAFTVGAAVLSAAWMSTALAAPYGVIKWDQPPVWQPAPENVYYGWNEVSWTRPGSLDAGPIVADDWKCETQDPVTDVHWWGSYLGWNQEEAPPQRPTYFHITIWTDVPQGVTDPWSHPGVVLWEYDCYDYSETFVGWDYDPRTNSLEACFYYDCLLPPTAWFYQDPGENIYWISIAAVFDCPCDGDLNGDGTIDYNDLNWFLGNCPPGTVVTPQCAQADLDCDGVITGDDEAILLCLIDTGDPQQCCQQTDPEFLWGWKTRPRDDASPAPDAAVLIFDPVDPHPGMAYLSGQPITWPGAYPADQWDMAFELTSQNVGNEYKVYEPPVLNPDSPYPDCFWGWDELSVHGGSQIGAADWLCIDPRPVSDIHWWGSYIGWDDPAAPPSIAPIGWVFTIWDTSATGTPNNVIWQQTATAREVTETIVGCDFHPDHGYDTTFYYEYDIPEQNWFYQEAGDNVYWISIAPIYDVQPCECNADFNGDGVIDGFDWNFLQNCWGPVMPGCEQADLNCDGIVDPIDAGIFDCQAAAGWPDPACCEQTGVPFPWGWKTKPYPQTAQPNPGAVIADPTAPVIGDFLRNGRILTDNQGEPWDYAFALTTPAGSGDPYVKWSQPPQPWDGAVIRGWDELSVWGSSQIAADDWLCDTPAPVTDIHWWGSFLNWTFPEPPRLPDRFRVTFWTDVPAGVDAPWSHPGTVVHEFKIENYAWTFVGFDFDPCGQLTPDACFRFDYDLPRADWFQQPLEEQIFWVSIAAEYDSVIDLHPFGWKTRPREPQSLAPDAAVRVYVPTTPAVGDVYRQGQPLECNDQQYDLSFVLTTCDTCGDMNGDGVVNSRDIDAFVLAITNPALFAATYPGVPITNGDCNGDGSVNSRDIDAFVYALVNMGCTP